MEYGVDLAMHGWTSEGWTSIREREGWDTSCAEVCDLLGRPYRPEEIASNKGTPKSE